LLKAKCMTLENFFKLVGENPSYLLLYFALIPLTAFVAGILGNGEGAITPWRELYSVLIYLVCVPGIFALMLGVYSFLFDRYSIYQTDILSQILPVCSMIVTLLIIKRNVAFDAIPGFSKLSGLVSLIAATFLFMWFIDKTHIYAMTYVPFWQVLILFGVLFLIIRYGWRRFIG